MMIVLGYDRPHRKTQDVLFMLKERGYDDVTVMVQEFIDRKNYFSLLPNRPHEPIVNLTTTYLAKELGYKVERYNPNALIAGNLFLLAGGRILSEDFVKYNTVVNSHPGYLPWARGLDSLKWSLLLGIPIGVTTHIIDPWIDAGYLIRRQALSISPKDTFRSLRDAVYLLELNMLIEAYEHLICRPDLLLNYEKRLSKLSHDFDTFPVRRRMPREKELQLLKKLKNKDGRYLGIRKWKNRRFCGRSHL